MGIILKGLSGFCGINYDIASGGYRCMFSENALAVEGIKSVSSLNSQLVRLRLKNAEMEITGENLYIYELCKGYISICGRILSVNVV